MELKKMIECNQTAAIRSASYCLHRYFKSNLDTAESSKKYLSTYVKVCAAGASGTWSWALRDPSLASRSLRERGMLNGRGWLELFNPIFDEFERFAPEDRLRLMMGESVGGVDPFYVFRPVIVYDDGTVVLPRGCPPDQVELENEMRDLWLSITTELIDGITILEHVADGPAAGL